MEKLGEGRGNHQDRANSVIQVVRDSNVGLPVSSVMKEVSV